MSRLTVTEKNHWKTRIEKRIDRAIEAIESKHHIAMQKVKDAATANALKQLGIDKLEAKRKQLKADRERLDDELDLLNLEIDENLLGKAERQRLGAYDASKLVQVRLQRMTERCEAELLASTAPGREIIRLRVEKESLLDTVWLATSSKQIRDLWSRVGKVLGEDSTPIQEQILDSAVDSRE